MHGRGHLVAKPGDGAHFLHHLCRRLAHIGHGVRGAGRYGQRDLVRAGAHGGLGSLEIGHQGHDGDAGVGDGVAHDRGGIGHLRQQLGRDKGADLDFLHARCHQGIDPGALMGRAHGGRDRLQAVAGADFADQEIEAVGE